MLVSRSRTNAANDSPTSPWQHAATRYICGAGGRTYLRKEPFDRRSLDVAFFRPHRYADGLGVAEPRRRSALDLACRFGIGWLQDETGAAVSARDASSSAPDQHLEAVARDLVCRSTTPQGNERWTAVAPSPTSW